MLVPALALVASSVAGAPPPRPADAAAAAELEADRALARAGAGEPGVAEVQAAAARRAEAVADPAAVASHRRAAALLPRVTAEFRYDERSYRTAGLQTAGEVDYVRFEPGTAFVVRATWDLGALAAPPGELAVAAAAAELARRRDEAVRRATALHFERRRLRVALLLEPPATARALADAELELARVTAELDAITGGLLRGRAP